MTFCNAQLKIQAKYLTKKLNITDFTASQMWCYRFMKSNRMSNWRKTKISQEYHKTERINESDGNMNVE